MRCFAGILAALVSIVFVGCGSDTQSSRVKDKPKPQVLTVDEFYADTNKEERDLRLVGQLKSWKSNPAITSGSSDFQATIAGEKGKTCTIFVPGEPKPQQPGEADAPKAGKWIIIDVRGSNIPVSRTNGEFTKGSLFRSGFETLEEALKAAGR
ncbi:MAG: hypothetical protein C0467_29910 [Planctomycetaceae bacterium]|nr:hypothetical protein [Planctomycetaceae bacterium]